MAKQKAIKRLIKGPKPTKPIGGKVSPSYNIASSTKKKSRRKVS